MPLAARPVRAFDDDITLDIVSSASGIAGRDYLFEMIENIADKDAAAALKVVDRLYSMSKDLKVLANELLVQMRNVMLVKTIDNSADLVICLPDELERLKNIAQKLKLDEILRDISVLQECNERFARCTSKRIELEMTLIRLCSDNAEKSTETVQNSAPSADVTGLVKRITTLEERLRNGTPVPRQTAAPQQPKQYDPELQRLSLDNDGPIKEWNDIVGKIKQRSPAIASFLRGSVAFAKQNDLFLIVQSDIYLKKFKASSDASIINDVLLETYGKTFNIKVKSAKKVAPDDADDPTNQLLDKAKASGIEVEIKKIYKEFYK